MEPARGRDRHTDRLAGRTATRDDDDAPYVGMRSVVRMRIRDAPVRTVQALRELGAHRQVRFMTSKEILRYVRAEPFRPFRLRMAGGRTFEIRHPEMVRVGRADLVIFSLVSDAPEIHDDWDTVSLVLIESISHLDAATTAS